MSMFYQQKLILTSGFLRRVFMSGSSLAHSQSDAAVSDKEMKRQNVQQRSKRSAYLLVLFLRLLFHVSSIEKLILIQ